ncbi:MAG: helix-turn-helix domain-containing protein [Pseudomonadota bacterium]
MTRRVESSVFHTTKLAPELRFDAWRESIGVMFDTRIDPSIRAQDFDARVESVLLDGLMLTRVRSGGQKFDRRPDRIMADSIDHYMVQVFRGGQVDMTVGSKQVTGQTGAMVGFDLGTILDSENSEFDVVTAIIPRRRLEPHLRNSASLHGQVLDPSRGAARLAADYLETLCAIGPDMTEDEAIPASDALVILLAAAFNQVPSSESDPPDWADHALLIRVKAEIAARLGDSALSAARLAGILGLSRSRLYKLFEPHGGVMHIVREMRLRRALNDLVTPRGQRYQISEIAYRWGFTGPAQFARAFRNRYGCSPKEARREGLAVAARRHSTMLADGTADIGDRKYETWIETLA